MAKFSRCLILLVLAVSLAGCVHDTTRQAGLRAWAGELPFVTRQMKTAGFWIARHPHPDKIILTPKEITSYNSYITCDLGLTNDIANAAPRYSGDLLSGALKEALSSVEDKGLYDIHTRPAGKAFFVRMQKKMRLEEIGPEINVRYGFISRYCDQRILPSDEGLFASPDDIDFDELQNSSLEIGAPVLILHESNDGAWLYVVAAASSGWVKSGNVAFCDKAVLADYVNRRPIAVMTASKADIYLDPSLRDHYGYVHMGFVLPLAEEGASDAVKVMVPFRADDGRFTARACYMKKDEVNIGYLPYTPRTILEQAFKMLNAPYGWGGMRGEQDCSMFIQEIFGTVGLKLPRNSSAQGKVGYPAGEIDKNTTDEDKYDILSKRAISGITLLYMKGHIMLYLGSVDGRPYAINALWAYREKQGDEELTRVVNRVAVAELSLGKGSAKGSLLNRISSIRIIGNPR
ncbi:MAG: SH3 domain-containing protein [Candidatus Omnitrophica bacterium]|nr:SH3 domain-containing protein [Candidatus Omnitrophota bacterium]